MLYMVLGKDFWELQKRILSRKYHMPLFETLRWENILKKLMALHPKDRGNTKALALDPTDRGTLKQITRDLGNSGFAGSHPVTWIPRW